MGYYYTVIKYELARAGYQVTLVKNTTVFSTIEMALRGPHSLAISSVAAWAAPL